MAREHRLILFETDPDTKARSVADIVSGKAPDHARFDWLLVLYRRCYKAMHDRQHPHILTAELDFHIGGDSRLKQPLTKGYEACETWCRNQMLDLIESLADLGP